MSRAAASTAVVIAAVLGSCARAGAPESPSPAGLLAAAIEARGGAALDRAAAFAWKGEAVVYAGGRMVEISGDWSIQPPDTAVVSTWLRSAGPAATRSLILAAPRGWTESRGTLAPMPPAMLANERDEFYLYDLIRLAGLRAAGVELVAIPADTAGNRGFRVSRPGRPPAELYVDATGRLAHVRLSVSDAAGGEPAIEDAWLMGTVEDGGVRWPRELRLDLRGERYFALTVLEFHVVPALRDPRLSGEATSR